MLRRVLVVVLIVLGVAAAAVAGGVAYLLSRLDVGAEIERIVENATGRDLVIAGDVGATFWPVIGLKAEDARLANVEGGRAPAFVVMDELDVGVEIWPLIEREVSVRRLVLRRPRIALEVDAEGRPNWILRPRAQPRPGEPRVEIARASLREIRIVGGELSFFDARRGAGWLVGEADLRSSIAAMDAPMRVRGTFRYNDREVALDATVGSPRQAAAGERTALRIEAESELANLIFEGQTIAASGELAGDISAGGPNLRALAAWLGTPFQGGALLENFAVSGRVAIGEGLLSFSNASFTVDKVSGRGDFTLAEVRGRPYLSGRLETFDFDANPYLPGQPAPAAASEGESAAAPGDIAVVASPARALDITDAPSAAPMDFSGLSAFNADLELISRAVLVQRMRIDRARLNLVLHDGFLALTLHDIGLYGGSGRGRMELDARESAVRLVQEVALDNVDARAFLSDAVNFSNIEGRGEVAFNVRTQGRTQSELIANADGRLHVEVVSGVLHGVDLGGVATTIRNALRGELIAPEARTPFHGFSGTFAIADGVLASDNLNFTTPDLRIPGVGVVDLNQRRLDLRLSPRSPRGGLTAPFTIRGPFGQFAYESDLRGRALRDIQARVDRLQAAAR